MKSDRTLDIAISGRGSGVQLTNGDYTRSLRLKYNAQGKLSTQDGDQELKIEYAADIAQDQQAQNWSYKKLRFTREGKIYDRTTGKYLGKLVTNLKEGGFIVQGYTERPNINVPMEIMELSDRLRQLDIHRTMYSIDVGLDREANNIARQTL